VAGKKGEWSIGMMMAMGGFQKVLFFENSNYTTCI